MDNKTQSAPTVQKVTKASSDELLRKFAQVGSAAELKKELQLAKRRRMSVDHHHQCESPSSRRTSWVEQRKSLLPPAGGKGKGRSVAVMRRLGIGRSRIRAKDLKNKSILGTIEKTWRKTVDGATKVFLEKHFNRHKRLINDGF